VQRVSNLILWKPSKKKKKKKDNNKEREGGARKLFRNG
jgi:hypothetical protein